MGYIPTLRKFEAQQSVADRITLLQVGCLDSRMAQLSFKKSDSFSSIFSSSPARIRASAPNSPTPNGGRSLSVSKWLVNSDRLGPIIRNKLGKRVDRPLSVHDDLLDIMRKRELCFWHYLRSDCEQSTCKKNHGYPRPLSPDKFEALWLLARAGICHQSRKGLDCPDDKCMYRHAV
jgi:hypothetical protein